MSESSLKAWASDHSHARPITKPASSTEDSEYQAFSFGRVGTRHQLMVEFVKADGYRLTLPYIDLKQIVTNNPQQGFELFFVTKTIRIEGDQLEDCYRYFKRNRVEYICEVTRAQAFSNEQPGGIVTQIMLSKPRGD